MRSYSLDGVFADGSGHVLLEDGERVFCRGWRVGDDGNRSAVLAVLPAAEHPSRSSLDRLTHEYGLKDELDGAWAVRPLDLVREGGQTVLVLEDAGGELLDRLLGAPVEVGRFLRLAIGIAVALGKLHQRGIVHKDIKPANIILNDATGEVRLTGFGIASRLSRERQAIEPPEALTGTLAYMAPEQTGRMNRSIDSRSDLYSLGITLYQMLTGSLPFMASDPLEWVHCHIARKPTPPAERLPNVPPALSAMVMKLLAKTAEDRYQTAGGVEHDLRRCLTDWSARGFIDDFPLGQQDSPDRLLIPEKLYGREREIAILIAAFDRIVKNGTAELVLVSGYSGIGKSSVVRDLHKLLVPPRRLFASGKFDQYKRDIPYSTLVQAFQGLVRPLLGKSEAELASWRHALLEALGPNARLMVDLVPDLKLIVGERPAVPELPPQQAQSRFQLVFRRFIAVFARPEHPLALFLDDLQWLDAATLDLIEHLLIQPDVRHLLLIGAYRNNEVGPAHPLTRKLDSIRHAGAHVQEITLAPLAREDLGQLIADALRCESDRVDPLAQLVHVKTAGNPFFVTQFLYALADEGLLRFDHVAARWSWDFDRIQAKGYTDNVVDLLVRKLARLPPKTQAALQQMACLGNAAEIAVLAIVLGTSEQDVRARQWEAVRQELIEHLEGSYRFIHDRVQEAAYSLIPQGLRAEAHLGIARTLAANIPAERRDEAVFEIVNHFSRGTSLITAPDEREQVAELNLMAGARAKASTAYASALTYLVAGAALLPEDSWERRHDLMFQLELHRSECEFLTGALAEAEQRLTALSARAATTVERASVACLRVDLYATLGQSGRAVAVGLEELRHLGIEWSAHPTEEEARGEYERIWSTLGDRPIEAIVDLPLMSDPASLATLDVLTKLAVPALYTDANLVFLVLCRIVNLSLEGGNSDGSSFAYEWLGGMIAGPRFGDAQTGFLFGRLGYDLVEQRGLKRFQARTYMSFGNVVLPWTRHVLTGRELVRRAFESANRSGDVTFAAYSCNHLNTNLLAAGDPLDGVQDEAERGLAFAQKMRVGIAIDSIGPQVGLIRTLRGLTPKFGCLDDAQFDERWIERRFSRKPDLALPECRYWVRKLQARYFAGDYAAAIDASSRAQRLLWTSPSHFETAEYHLYGALSHAASCAAARTDECRQHVDALVAHHRQLDTWAADCPENFENRAALVGAEIARIEGRALDAMDLYEKAIRSAQANGFVHNEALAYELAARFYAARGLDTFARAYLSNARHCYLRWGADGKVRQLEQLHPHLREEEPAPTSTGTIGTPVEHLDLATVIKVSQAVSGEIVLDKLIDTLMRMTIEQAGAEHVLLVLARGTEHSIAAEATTSGDTVVVNLRAQTATAAVLPESMLRYVLRTQETVVLDDATTQNPFSGDPYILQHQARSILCLPLVNQAKLIGVLYLENNLTPHVFAPARIAVLKLLASQAAISLENSRLYGDLQEREAKIRRLVDANIIGIFIWDFDGRILEANEAFLNIVGYDREDLVADRIRWTDLTPPEWRERDTQLIQEQKVAGTLRPFEKEYFRKDGSRVPVLIGVATFEEGGNQGVAFVLDLSERKGAEEALRRSEANLAAAQRLSHTGSWALSPTATHILYWSDECYRIWGFDPAQGLPNRETVWRRIHPGDRGRVLDEAEKALQQKRDYSIDFRIVLPDGTVKYLEAIGHHLFSADGELAQVVGTNVDVTERKRAEEALRDSEYKLRQIIETVPGLVWSTGPDGEPTHLSQKVLDYSGLQFEDFLHLGWKEFIHPDDFPETMNSFFHAIQTGTPYHAVHRLRRADGEYRWHRAQGEPLRDREGRIIHWYGLTVDIDEIKKAEDRLRRSEAYLAETQKLSHTGSWAYDPVARQLLYWSEECYRIWGFDPTHGLPDREVAFQRIHPDDRDRVNERAMGERLQKRDHTAEFRIVLPDGTVKYVEGAVHHVFSEEGELIELVGTNVDVTERKRARDEHERLRQLESDLAHMNRLGVMGELTASLAHEVTQPISSARNNARAALNFLDQGPPELGEVREALSCIVGDADRAGSIVDRIRDQVSKAPPRKQHFDLNESIDEVLVLARSAISKNGVSVQTRLADGLLPVHGDRVQLQQVVLNLILNAVEAMGSVQGGPRELSISTEQGQVKGVLVAIRDSGPGIDPANRERVFEAFYTTKTSGVGMGLSICRSIINTHGGRLWADANEPRGAVFQFTLPDAGESS